MPSPYSSYTEEMADRICELMAEGKSLRQVCEMDGMPDKRTVRRWLKEQPEFVKRYEMARQDLLDHWADEIMDIADDGSNDYKPDADGVMKVDKDHINRSRLRVDTRKWILSKLMPKKYGDKLEVAGDGGGPLVVQIVKFNDEQ